MPKRGPGAARQRLAREKVAAKRKRKPKWAKKGLPLDEAVVLFIQDIPITKGPLAGTKVKLLPSHEKFIREIFSRPADNPVRLAIQSEPRGQGKSAVASFLILAAMFGPLAVPRGELYCCAVDRDQSGKLFAEVSAIIEAVTEFDAQCNVIKWHKKIEVDKGPGKGTIFEAMSGDARKGHGLAPGPLYIIDEMARIPDREMFDAMWTGSSKRPCVGIILSTQAPDNFHPLSQLIDDGLSGVDPSILVHLTCAPEEADPFDPKTLLDCNPAAGIFLDKADLLAKQEMARRQPAAVPSFRNLHLNQRIDARRDDRILPAELWKELAADVSRESLKGRVAYAGLDLSAWDDLSSLCLAIPGDGPDPDISLVSINWTPRDAIIERTPQEAALFREWISAGHLTEIPGKSIRMSFIAAEMRKLQDEFKIKVCFFDMYKIKDLQTELEDVNCTVPLEKFGQGYISMSPAIQWFSEYALAGKLKHPNNPVLNAALAAAVITRDAALNRKPDKEKSRRSGATKIDPLAAALMAVAACKQYHEEKKPTLEGFIRAPIMVI